MAASGINWIPAQTFTRSEADYVEAVKLCLERGAPVNATNSLQLAAIHGAANRGWTSIIQLLADAGAKLDVEDVGGRTPMTFARRHLPGDPAAGGQARGDRAAEEAGRAMNRLLLASRRRVRAWRAGPPVSGQQRGRRGWRPAPARHRRRVAARQPDLLPDLPQRAPEDRRPLARRPDARSRRRRRDLGEGGPQGARRHDAARRRQAARARRARRLRRLDRERDRSRRGGQPESRTRAAAPHEPRRVRERDPRSAGARRRLLYPAAGRRLEPRLRQHRRRARRVAVAARALRRGGREDQPAGRRRARRRAGPGHLHGEGRSQPEPDARRASRSARAAAPPSRTTSRSTAST